MITDVDQGSPAGSLVLFAGSRSGWVNWLDGRSSREDASMIASIQMALDLIAIISAFVAAMLWFYASGRQLRRITKNEAVDEHDLNRLVVAFNRTQILNGRAALVTGISAVAISLRTLLQFGA
ncbi:MAG: hypothetical protein NW216_06490 [Hyphomicrobium sp.]|nr:hypothetical protein [Hyphomicrobium sp.]